jgi:hypothetical protein
VHRETGPEIRSVVHRFGEHEHTHPTYSAQQLATSGQGAVSSSSARGGSEARVLVTAVGSVPTI